MDLLSIIHVAFWAPALCVHDTYCRTRLPLCSFPGTGGLYGAAKWTADWLTHWWVPGAAAVVVVTCCQTPHLKLQSTTPHAPQAAKHNTACIGILADAKAWLDKALTVAPLFAAPAVAPPSVSQT